MTRPLHDLSNINLTKIPHNTVSNQLKTIHAKILKEKSVKSAAQQRKSVSRPQSVTQCVDEDETPIMVKDELLYVESRISHHANELDLARLRLGCQNETPAYHKAFRCMCLLMKALQNLLHPERQINPQEGFTEWSRIQLYILSEHFKIRELRTICQQIRAHSDLICYKTLEQLRQFAFQENGGLESPKVRHAPLKVYFSLCFFVLKYCQMIQSLSKQDSIFIQPFSAAKNKAKSRNDQTEVIKKCVRSISERPKKVSVR